MERIDARPNYSDCRRHNREDFEVEATKTFDNKLGGDFQRRWLVGVIISVY
jgi:hypothetical protein